MHADTKRAMLQWCNSGNPSASYAAAEEAKKMMDDFRGILCEAASVTPNDYMVIFTGSASEANGFVLQSVVDAYTDARGEIPHVIMSAIEHKSLTEHAKSLLGRGKIELSWVAPTSSGHVRPTAIAEEIRRNTCLICVMHANNETGAINDVEKIGEIAHGRGIPFHCDTVQTFGKFAPKMTHIDSCVVSFHKFGGPPGVGAIIINRKFVTGYKLHPMIYGTQNFGMRGGTENLPGIGAALTATRSALNSRPVKNRELTRLKIKIINGMAARFPMRQYTAYIADSRGPRVELILLSGATEYYIPGTLLLSVIRRDADICNSKMKKALEEKKIIVSIGSACNTASAKASHVLYAMGADDMIRRGTLRISLGDDNTGDEIDIFIKEFSTVIDKFTT